MQKNKNLGAIIGVVVTGESPVVLTLRGLTSSGSPGCGRISASNNRVAVQKAIRYGMRSLNQPMGASPGYRRGFTLTVASAKTANSKGFASTQYDPRILSDSP